MKRIITVYPKYVGASASNRYVRCSSGIDVASVVQEYIQDKVDIAGELGFIDGDWFAYCKDEAFYYGSIGKCIRQAGKFVASHPDCGKDDIIDFLFDSGAIPCYFSMSKIVNAFKRHGKFDQIPEWFFE